MAARLRRAIVSATIAVVAAALLIVAGAARRPALAHDMAGMDVSAANGMGARTAMSAHMRLTKLRARTPGDVARARDILSTLRRVLQPYRNYRAALLQGDRIFMPSVPQDVYHFVDYAASNQEYTGNFNREHPGSLLYVKKPGGDYVLVGAMYSAPADFTPDQLNELVPLSIARWHQHVNICLPIGITLDDLLRGYVGGDDTGLPGMIPVSASPDALRLDREYGVFADGRFGFEGTIADAQSCRAAGGHFLPLAFGWMVHVYPYSGDDLKVAFGLSVPEVAAN
jgi:hypothetical protein